MGVIFMLCVWWANIVRDPGQDFFPIYFYATILLVYAVHQVIIVKFYFHSIETLTLNKNSFTVMFLEKYFI